MATGHWSRDMATLWWRDKGTGRMRVSFHREPQKLVDKYHKLWHETIDAAIYLADGTRKALPGAPEGEKKGKRKARPKKKKEAAAEPVAA